MPSNIIPIDIKAIRQGRSPRPLPRTLELRREIAGYMRVIQSIELQRQEIVAEHLEIVQIEQELQQDMRILLANASQIETKLIFSRQQLDEMEASCG